MARARMHSIEEPLVRGLFSLMRERVVDLCTYFRTLDCPLPSWRYGTPRCLFAALLAHPGSKELVVMLFDEDVVTNAIHSKMCTVLPS